MIQRKLQSDVGHLLTEFSAVGLLGPRQVGKTTLAEAIASEIQPTPIHLNLESPADLAKLNDPLQ